MTLCEYLTPSASQALKWFFEWEEGSLLDPKRPLSWKKPPGLWVFSYFFECFCAYFEMWDPLRELCYTFLSFDDMAFIIKKQ